jgi:hypothetical protein
VSVTGWHVSSFIVRPNQLVREGPHIGHNIEHTRGVRARPAEQRPFPAIRVSKPWIWPRTKTLRTFDWGLARAAGHAAADSGDQDHYDFDIDIDRYRINGSVRQVMLATRELNVDRLPESSRNWINERLIYTHGYGITMNPVNGFTPEGLPELLLSNMPVQSTVPGLQVTRPEIYFGELTNGDVYVKTRQQEFTFLRATPTALAPTRATVASCSAGSCGGCSSRSTAAT